MGNKGSANIQSIKHQWHLVFDGLSESLFNEECRNKEKKLYKTVDKIIAKKNSSLKNKEAKFDPLNILTAFLVS